jgi:hypothetical protein
LSALVDKLLLGHVHKTATDFFFAPTPLPVVLREVERKSNKF